MERPSAAPGRLDEVRDGFELAHAMLGPRVASERPLAALAHLLAAGVAARDAEGPRRAATRMKTHLTPAHTRGLDARCKALLAPEVGGATGRRWLSEAPPRPGFAADPGVRACVRALATARTTRAHSGDEPHAE